MPAVRTFIAVEVSDEVRAAAARLVDRLARTEAKVKWVDPHNMHLTVKFLGDVAQTQVPEICRVTNDAVRDLSPFDVGLAGAGAFPTLARPRTIWLGLSAGIEPLTRLHKAIDTAVRKLGFAREGRKYHPHLTLGRVRGGGSRLASLADAIRDHQEYAAGVSSIDEVVVFSSELTRDGPRYTALGRGALGGDGP